jgi:hypothetical protein
MATLRELSLDEKIILKRIISTYDTRKWGRFIWLKVKTNMKLCEHCKCSNFIKVKGLLYCLVIVEFPIIIMIYVISVLLRYLELDLL